MKKFYRLTKRAVTLIEMLIVMFIIATIIGVVAYNYSGTLDEGKAFKTKTAMEKVHTILVLKQAEGTVDIENEWEDIVKRSPMVQNPNQIIKDGWGEKFRVVISGDDIEITSKKYEEYIKKNPHTMFGEDA